MHACSSSPRCPCSCGPSTPCIPCSPSSSPSSTTATRSNSTCNRPHGPQIPSLWRPCTPQAGPTSAARPSAPGGCVPPASTSARLRSAARWVGRAPASARMPRSVGRDGTATRPACCTAKGPHMRSFAACHTQANKQTSKHANTLAICAAHRPATRISSAASVSPCSTGARSRCSCEQAQLGHQTATACDAIPPQGTVSQQ